MHVSLLTIFSSHIHHSTQGGDFLPPGEEPNYLDVLPQGGTLVLFKSDKIPHEVLDTRNKRVAVVGWFNRPFSAADISLLSTEEDKTKSIMLLVAAALVGAGTLMILFS